MNKTCAAIRHVHFEDSGSFAHPLQQNGYSMQYLEAATDDLSPAKEADLTIFLGGPIGVYEEDAYPFLKQEIAIAEHRLATQKPTLGICLGSQIIARAAGTKVYPGQNGKEIGWKPLLLTESGRNSVIAPLGDNDAQMLHWHGDTFDLPEQAALLASTDSYPNQIFSIGSHVLAFQCHPELAPDNIEHWLLGHAVEISKTNGVTPGAIRHDTSKYGVGLVQRGQTAIQRWLRSLEN